MFSTNKTVTPGSIFDKHEMWSYLTVFGKKITTGYDVRYKVKPEILPILTGVGCIVAVVIARAVTDAMSPKVK